MRHFLTTWLAPFLLSATAAAICYSIAGPTLDLFIGSLLLLAILTPPLVLATDSISTIVAIIIGTVIVWLVPTANHAIAFTQWLGCSTILIATLLAISAVVRLLTSLRLTPILSSALTTILALAWFTWPVWASPHLSGMRVSLPVRLHPLFAMNAVCNNLGVWTEQRVAYHLTNLGQDAIYQLPMSMFPAVAFHLGIAVLCWVMVMSGRGQSKPQAVGEVSDNNPGRKAGDQFAK